MPHPNIERYTQRPPLTRDQAIATDAYYRWERAARAGVHTDPGSNWLAAAADYDRHERESRCESVMDRAFTPDSADVAKVQLAVAGLMQQPARFTVNEIGAMTVAQMQSIDPAYEQFCQMLDKNELPPTQGEQEPQEGGFTPRPTGVTDLVRRIFCACGRHPGRVQHPAGGNYCPACGREWA